MPPKRSAGLLVFRHRPAGVQVLLGHMGGPFWARRDDRAWSIPKGEYMPDELPEDAARREYREELGLPPPDGDSVPLGEVRQSGGKTVSAWAIEGEVDPSHVVPGTFDLEWPRGSGQMRAFPELDRVAWFDVSTARTKIVAAQEQFLDRLEAYLQR